MQQNNILERMFRIGLFALLFGATSAYAQTSGTTESKKDSSGLTQENKAGQMSPTGQNETSSATPSASSGSTSGGASSGGASSGASGSAGQSASGADKSTESSKDSSGLTQENKSGQMSPTGQNETTSATPSTSGASGSAGQGASGASDSSAGAGKAASGKLSKGDQNIMRELAYANLSEIETGKIALNQSKNDQVRSFAQKMIDDHTQAQKDLEQLAQSKGVTLPTEPDKKHQAAAKKLGALEGEKFDKQYLSQGGMRDHRNTHKLLQRAQTRATDSDLKALVTKMEPIVSQHLTMAQDASGAKSSTSGSMGAAGTSATSSGPGSSGSAGTSGVSGTSGSSNSTSPGKQ